MRLRVKYLLYKMGLVRYIKVEVYLRSGQTIKFKCKEWSIEGYPPTTQDDGLKRCSFKEIKGETIWFNISEVVAVRGES